MEPVGPPLSGRAIWSSILHSVNSAPDPANYGACLPYFGSIETLSAAWEVGPDHGRTLHRNVPQRLWTFIRDALNGVKPLHG